MARPKKVQIFPGYVQTKDINPEELARLTDIAKGSRTSNGFGEMCNTSGATISRILNCKINSPLSEGLLKNIYDNAENKTDLTQEMFLLANGMVKIDTSQQERLLAYAEGIQELMAERNAKAHGTVLENAAREIIQNAMLTKGFNISPLKELVFFSQKKGFKYFADFGFETSALSEYGIKEWYFDVMVGLASHAIHKMNSIFAACYLGKIGSKGRKISLVISDKKAFDILIDKYQDIMIEDCISFILIDTTERIVVDEYYLNNGKDYKNIF